MTDVLFTAQTVLIRPDVGPSAGLGHLGRCLALAQGLERFGAQSVFAVHPDRHADERIDRNGFRRITLASPAGTEAELPELCDAYSQAGATAIVLDSYHLGAETLRALREGHRPLVAIDDLATFATPAHIVVDGSSHADQMPHRSATGDTEFLLGVDYAMLSREYWQPRPRQLRAEVRRLLVTLGGGGGAAVDPLIDALADLPGSIEIHWVVGPYDKRRPVRLAERLGESLFVFENPASLYPFLLEADLVVCAGGQTTYQAAAAGTPALALAISDNQMQNVRTLSRSRVVETVPLTGSDSDSRAIRAALDELIAPSGLRQRLSENGQRLVDGQGAIRVARRIGYLTERLGRG